MPFRIRHLNPLLASQKMPSSSMDLRKIIISSIVPLVLLTIVAVSGEPSTLADQHLQQQQRITRPNQRQYLFKENCADEPDGELLSCTVSNVDCAVNMEQLFPPASSFPTEAHDLRIEPFAKATPRRLAAALHNNNNGGNGTEGDGDGTVVGGNAAGGGHHHQLLVDISWQIPPNNSTRALRGFLLEIEGENGRKHACFLLNVSSTVWSDQAIAASPRLHFTTESVFSFAQNYEIELYSLPERSIGTGASVHTRFTTPHNPNGGGANGGLNTHMVAANCTKQSNQYASKWTAGFRHIYIHSAARIMQVEFVGAPPQYCFEQYEVRLLDETGLELLYSGTVSVDEMQRNGSIILGQYNFTDLEYDSSYIPSVIPVERAADGRCLCPVFGTDPYDMTVVCSCVAADWKPVRMSRPNVVKLSPNTSALIMPPPVEQLGTEGGGGPHGASRDDNVNFWLWLMFINMFLMVVFVLFGACLRCKFINETLGRKGQQFHGRIRFVPAKQPHNADGTAPLCHQQSGNGTGNNNNCGGGGAAFNLVPPLVVRSTTTLPALAKTMMLSGTNGNGDSNSTMPLIGNNEEEKQQQQQLQGSAAVPTNLLIVYAHDGPAHERAVAALAEFLCDVFHVNVQLDCWQIAQIEANLTDWLSASVVCADKVLIVNSRGARERYHAKCTSQGRWAVERTDAGLLDHLFVAHIDMALQHHSIVSARFGYTSTHLTLPMLGDRLQYILPHNISPLVSALFGCNMRQDVRLQEAALASTEALVRLRQAIEEMSEICREQPDWFALTHQRRWQQQHEKIGWKSEEEEGEEQDTGIGTQIGEEDNEEKMIGGVNARMPMPTTTTTQLMVVVDETREEEKNNCAGIDDDANGVGGLDSGLLSMEQQQLAAPIPLVIVAAKKHVDFAAREEPVVVVEEEDETLDAVDCFQHQQLLLDGGDDNNGKMDSGIFEWTGTGGSASADEEEDEAQEKENNERVIVVAQRNVDTSNKIASKKCQTGTPLEATKLVAQLVAQRLEQQQTCLTGEQQQHTSIDTGVGMFVGGGGTTNAIAECNNNCRTGGTGGADDSGVLFTSEDIGTAAANTHDTPTRQEPSATTTAPPARPMVATAII